MTVSPLPKDEDTIPDDAEPMDDDVAAEEESGGSEEDAFTMADAPCDDAGGNNEVATLVAGWDADVEPVVDAPDAPPWDGLAPALPRDEWSSASSGNSHAGASATITMIRNP